MDASSDVAESFRLFVKETEPRLRHALVALLGQDRGRDAVAEALAYGWEHWDRVGEMVNPAGYLYRVGRRRVGRGNRFPGFAPVPSALMPDVEPMLPEVLARLSEKQRVAVVMVHAYEWSRAEAAEVLGVTISTLDTHLQRGLKRLRESLGVESYA